VVYTSDLLRAWETARAVAESTGAPLIADEGLRERGFGVFQGKTFTEIEATCPTRPSAGASATRSGRPPAASR
jgi:probable phosphoglycerate mutase